MRTEIYCRSHNIYPKSNEELWDIAKILWELGIEIDIRTVENEKV